MMLDSVPCRMESCIGTGTVVVVSPAFFCIIRWLPLWRTVVNPFCSNILQTCDPERSFSLPNRDLNLSDKDLAMEPASNLRRVRRLEE